jgi:hypothetical protein
VAWEYADGSILPTPLGVFLSEKALDSEKKTSEGSGEFKIHFIWLNLRR